MKRLTKLLTISRIVFSEESYIFERDSLKVIIWRILSVRILLNKNLAHLRLLFQMRRAGRYWAQALWKREESLTSSTLNIHSFWILARLPGGSRVLSQTFQRKMFQSQWLQTFLSQGQRKVIIRCSAYVLNRRGLTQVQIGGVASGEIFANVHSVARLESVLPELERV